MGKNTIGYCQPGFVHTRVQAKATAYAESAESTAAHTVERWTR